MSESYQLDSVFGTFIWKLKIPEGKYKILYTGSGTVHTNKCKHITFWESLCEHLHNGDQTFSGVQTFWGRNNKGTI